MSILEWLNKKEKQQKDTKKLDIPGDLWVKCFSCSDILYLKELETDFKVCKSCGYHFRITPEERLKYIFDLKSFAEIEANLSPVDFLEFEDTQNYKARLKTAKEKTKRHDAVIVGTAKIFKKCVNVGVMDFSFMGGSMGSVVGEKIARLIEKAISNLYPLIIFTSSGGARMQEGIMSLMQMAKTSAALQKLAEVNVPFISVMCDPTTGGTTASFAMLGDVNIGEPGALISFAGPRVIEQTIRQKLPKGFQRAEFLLEHGQLDLVLERKEMRNTLYQLVEIMDPHGKPE